MSLPSGTRDTGISLRLAKASGMPMIVIAIAAALTRCPMASHIPKSSTQMTLPIRAPVPALGFSTIVRPNGHSAYDAMRKCRETEGDGDDEHEADKRCDQVSECQPEAAENQPDNVQD